MPAATSTDVRQRAALFALLAALASAALTILDGDHLGLLAGAGWAVLHGALQPVSLVALGWAFGMDCAINRRREES